MKKSMNYHMYKMILYRFFQFIWFLFNYWIANNNVSYWWWINSQLIFLCWIALKSKNICWRILFFKLFINLCPLFSSDNSYIDRNIKIIGPIWLLIRSNIAFSISSIDILLGTLWSDCISICDAEIVIRYLYFSHMLLQSCLLYTSPSPRD